MKHIIAVTKIREFERRQFALHRRVAVVLVARTLEIYANQRIRERVIHYGRHDLNTSAACGDHVIAVLVRQDLLVVEVHGSDAGLYSCRCLEKAVDIYSRYARLTCDIEVALAVRAAVAVRYRHARQAVRDVEESVISNIIIDRVIRIDYIYTLRRHYPEIILMVGDDLEVVVIRECRDIDDDAVSHILDRVRSYDPVQVARLVSCDTHDYVTRKSVSRSDMSNVAVLNQVHAVTVGACEDLTVITFAYREDYRIVDAVLGIDDINYLLIPDYRDTRIGTRDDRSVSRLICAADLIARHAVIGREL